MPAHTLKEVRRTVTSSGRGEGERLSSLGTLAIIKVPGEAMPMEVGHTFRLDSIAARVLMLSTPAGLEQMVRDGSVPAITLTLPPSETHPDA
jgi:hypothetical protein